MACMGRVRDLSTLGPCPTKAYPVGTRRNTEANHCQGQLERAAPLTSRPEAIRRFVAHLILPTSTVRSINARQLSLHLSIYLFIMIGLRLEGAVNDLDTWQKMFVTTSFSSLFYRLLYGTGLDITLIGAEAVKASGIDGDSTAHLFIDPAMQQQR